MGFDAGDHPRCTTTRLAGLDIDPEHTLEALHTEFIAGRRSDSVLASLPGCASTIRRRVSGVISPHQELFGAFKRKKSAQSLMQTALSDDDLLAMNVKV